MAGRLPRRTLLALLGVLAFCALWEGYGRLTASARLAPEVRQVLNDGGRQDVFVRLDAPPEQFHVKLFQGYGTVSAVREDGVLLRRVPAERVAELARFYWIAGIDPAQD